MATRSVRRALHGLSSSEATEDTVGEASSEAGEEQLLRLSTDCEELNCEKILLPSAELLVEEAEEETEFDRERLPLPYVGTVSL